MTTLTTRTSVPLPDGATLYATVLLLGGAVLMALAGLVIALAEDTVRATLSGGGLLLGALFLVELVRWTAQTHRQDDTLTADIAKAALQHTEELGSMIHEMLARAEALAPVAVPVWRAHLAGPEVTLLAYADVVALRGLVRAFEDQDIPLTPFEQRVALATRRLQPAGGPLRSLRDGQALIGVPATAFNTLKRVRAHH